MSTTTRTLTAGAVGTAVGLAVLWGVASQLGPAPAGDVDLPVPVTARIDGDQYRYESADVTWVHPTDETVPHLDLCVHRHDPAVHAPAGDHGHCGPVPAGAVRRAHPESGAGGGAATPTDRSG